MSETEKTGIRQIPFKTLLLVALALLTVIIWKTQQPDAPSYPVPLSSSREGQKTDSLSPGQLLVDERLALTLADQGDYAGAADKLTQILRQRPDDEEIHSRLAEALSYLGKNEEAASHYAEAVRLNHRDHSSLKGLALSLGRLGKAKEAEEKFRDLIKKDPKEADIHYFLGLTLVMQEKREEAMAPYTEALRLNPQHVMAMNDLAWILATHPKQEIRNGREAVALAERACQLTRYRDPQLIGTLDACYAEDQRFDEAITTAQKAAELGRHLGNFALAEAAKKREELYWQGKPFRDTSLAPK